MHCENDERGDERLEYRLEQKVVDRAVIALRFRNATERDILFMEKLNRLSIFSKASVRNLSASSPKQGSGRDEQQILQLDPVDHQRVAADINFANVNRKSLMQCYKKTSSSGQEMCRVLPYPNPSMPESTEWMTKAEINDTAHLPSSTWVTAGCGQAGTMHLEILGCDKLPQLETS